MLRIIFLLLFLALPRLEAFAQTSLIPFGSSWSYLDNGSDQGTAWRATSFNDTGWKTGNGLFGYGLSGVSTTISYGPNAKKKYITTYFRKSISIADVAAYSSFTAGVKRDDGVVVYVNGAEVYRNNMPTGTITYTTTASEAKDNGTVPQTFTIPTSAFTSGPNVIAVEVHQQRANTPDMAFDLELIGNPASPVNQPPTVSISSPTEGSNFTLGQTVSITAQASDPEGSLAEVEFFANGVSLGRDNTSPYGTSWTPSNTGTYSLTAKATDGAGATNTSASVSVTITEAPVNYYSLQVSTVGSGTVTKNPDQATYAAGSTVTLTATPATGYQFSDWSGDASGTTNPLSVTMDRNKSLTATFTVVQDQTPPAVLSISRQNPTAETTTATTVVFRTTFSEQVTGVDPGDFTATTVSGTVKGTVTASAAVGTNGAVYDITVSSISGEGALRLDLKAKGTSIVDIAGNAISGGYTSGETYTLVASIEEPKILYYEGFESGTAFADMHIQSSTSYGLTVVSNPTFSGTKVGRWELRAGDPPAANGTRAEVLFSEALAQQETWHSYAGYFPSVEYMIDRDNETFNQWHQGASGGYGTPMLTFRTINGRYEVRRRSADGSSSTYYNLGPIIYDQWVEFVIYIKQHLTDGVMQIWINGELKLNIQGGATMFDGPYGRWKMGIYKSDWNNGGTTDVTKRVWYVDEVKIGNAASTYTSMKPSGNNISVLTVQAKNNQGLLQDSQKKDEQQTDLLEVYPTLARRGSIINVNTNSTETAEAFVTDVTGRTITVFRSPGTTSLETNNLPSGLYFINLTTKKQLKQIKFIVTD